MGDPDPRRKLRVLHVVDALRPHGMQIGVMELIHRTRGEFDSIVLCLREPGECAEVLSRVGVPVHCLHRGDRHEWTLVWRIFRFLRGRGIDVVHTRNWGAIDALPAATAAGVPIRIHGEHGSGPNEAGAVARRRSQARRWLAPFVTSFVTVSGSLGRWLATEVGIRPDKIRVVPNGVDARHFRPAPDRDAVRAQLGYGPGELLVGSVGRLDAVKQFDVLLQAFALLHQSERRARLVIVGDGPERAALEAMVRRLRLSAVVRLPAHQADVRPWLQALDLFVLPSAREGTSRALLEAMATGVAVIATAVGGSVEILADAHMGTLIPSGDVTALTTAMQHGCADPLARRRLGEAARERVVDAYRIEAAVRVYAQLYRGAAVAG